MYTILQISSMLMYNKTINFSIKKGHQNYIEFTNDVKDGISPLKRNELASLVQV